MRQNKLESSRGRQNPRRQRTQYDTMASPLKPALDLAVSKLAHGLQNSRQNISTSRSRLSYCQTERTPHKHQKIASSRLDRSHCHSGKMHPETLSFLKKYF
jgi:hypothetical protein